MAADITLDGCTGVVVIGATTSGGSENMIEITGGSTRCQFRGAVGRNIQLHGIVISGASWCTISGNVVDGAGSQTTNTYDGIIVSGDSDNNRIEDNEVIARALTPFTRYGINVSASTCNCNVVIHNSGSDPADFGTDALVDSGTQTWLDPPSDPTYGSNMFGCNAGS